MSENRFINAFNKNIFDVHLLKENEHETNGIMLHMKEYSLKYNGFGTYFDDFYLDPSLRGKGLGRRMLAELCEYLLNNNRKFIKIIYQKKLGLDNFYNHLGFVNYSDNFSLYLYEGNNSDFRNVLQTADKEPNAIVLRDIAIDSGFPIFKVTATRGARSYSFCCQFYFNSWSGFGILFSDFTGETSIARLSDFRSIADRMLDQSKQSADAVEVVWWQVSLEQRELGSCVESCFTENIYSFGWKISYLNERGMQELSHSLDIP